MTDESAAAEDWEPLGYIDESGPTETIGVAHLPEDAQNAVILIAGLLGRKSVELRTRRVAELEAAVARAVAQGEDAIVKHMQQSGVLADLQKDLSETRALLGRTTRERDECVKRFEQTRDQLEATGDVRIREQRNARAEQKKMINEREALRKERNGAIGQRDERAAELLKVRRILADALQTNNLLTPVADLANRLRVERDSMREEMDHAVQSAAVNVKAAESLGEELEETKGTLRTTLQEREDAIQLSRVQRRSSDHNYNMWQKTVKERTEEHEKLTSLAKTWERRADELEREASRLAKERNAARAAREDVEGQLAEAEETRDRWKSRAQVETETARSMRAERDEAMKQRDAWAGNAPPNALAQGLQEQLRAAQKQSEEWRAKFVQQAEAVRILSDALVQLGRAPE
jgi:chromosome segregation ATPase